MSDVYRVYDRTAKATGYGDGQYFQYFLCRENADKFAAIVESTVMRQVELDTHYGYEPATKPEA